MERFSQRESVLLGYSPQKSFMNDRSSPQAQQRNSDIDFNDVFGGPPKRSSVHEFRCSYSDGTDYYVFRGDDGNVASRNSWNGLSEKPVFGDEGFSRRRYTSENFFDDIYKGNESLSSSPRKRDWDPYSSSPGSRVLSPARPLPPNAEPFGTSLPAQFSLPAKLTKGMELPTFGSVHHSPCKSKDGASNGISHYSSPHSRSSSLNQGDEERNDHRSSYRQSILSREFSLSRKESLNLTRSAEADTGGDSEKESNSSEVLTSSNQFHFSIYKWASKGIPLAMPLRGGSRLRARENSNNDRLSSSDEWIAKESELPREILHDSKLSADGKSANANSYAIEHDKKNIGTSDTSNRDRLKMQERVDPGDSTSQNTGEETKSKSKCEKDFLNKFQNVSVVSEEAHKPELKSLRSLFYDKHYEQSNEEITKKATEKERTAKSTKKASVVPDFSKNIKKQDGKIASLDSAEVGKGSQQGSSMNSRGLGKTRGKGKVKEFVKMFNEEVLSKSKIDIDLQSQSSRWKNTDNSKAEKVGKEASFSKIRTDEKIHVTSGHEKKPYGDASIMVNGNLSQSAKQSAINNTNCMSSGTFGQKNSSTTGNGSKAVVGDMDESFQENFLVRELTKDENKLPKASSDPEDIQVIDAEIRKWSNGKEGNIRSLLSTLQYVLWPESGWKTVPLVEIIEGNAVKRSYQKALLCLHPDKLQQKGATSQQKYIAEKVFDILQDAWTHFNSLGSL